MLASHLITFQNKQRHNSANFDQNAHASPVVLLRASLLLFCLRSEVAKFILEHSALDFSVPLSTLRMKQIRVAVAARVAVVSMLKQKSVHAKMNVKPTKWKRYFLTLEWR